MDEVAHWRKRDPLLIAAPHVPTADAIRAEVTAEIADLVERAKATPPVDPARATESVTSAWPEPVR